ncbi:TetR family transcriptional regulator [Bacillus sp. J14TS2]|uniref:TetR/AcrR family transcriptional regulator n=1 Tax=Bacillus sp. J14TS2 TaxID=2807188 RepID=UPI001B2CC288|nr:TetR/AcrR family transcriptional regulator [Bacillus sp. J14TS2]GIN74095.1 TetR family transcriptional regulator [Bacillus sp. J14TS2]
MSKKRAIGRPPTDLLKKPTKEKIEDHAQTLFLNYSYQEVSMDDVAKAANVTKATVYYYFSNKSRLYTETMIRMLGRIRKQVQEILQKEQSFDKNLYEVAERFLTATLHLDIDALTRGTETALEEKDWQDMNQAVEGIYDALEQGFQAAMDKGQLHSTFSSKFSSRVFFSLLNVGNGLNNIEQKKEDDIEKNTKDIIRFFQKGVLQ